MSKRPSWNEYFSGIAKLTASRSNCIRRQVGCVIVNNNRIISTGYNGTPFGIKNCFEKGCQRCNDRSVVAGSALEDCICLHAEENAILTSHCNLNGFTMYCTHKPCLGCLKRIIQVGIATVYYKIDYPCNDIYSNLLLQSNVKILKC